MKDLLPAIGAISYGCGMLIVYAVIYLIFIGLAAWVILSVFRHFGIV